MIHDAGRGSLRLTIDSSSTVYPIRPGFPLTSLSASYHSNKAGGGGVRRSENDGFHPCIPNQTQCILVTHSMFQWHFTLNHWYICSKMGNSGAPIGPALTLVDQIINHLNPSIYLSPAAKDIRSGDPCRSMSSILLYDSM